MNIDIEPQAHAASKAKIFDQPNDAIPTMLTSIAISLKRIADQLSYSPSGEANIFDLIREISQRNSG